MFPNFTSFNIQTDQNANITIHGVKGGSGPPLLLLHGCPQTHHIWHLVAPQLALDYTVVAIDLRGYGSSSKPPGTSDHLMYSKTAMASDCVSVMSSLGFPQFFVCAHDRGARVAHQLCINSPGSVIKAIFLDICPTLAMYSKTDQTFATAYWHWFFLIQPAPLPETLLSQNPRQWLLPFMGGFGSESIFAPEAFEEYIRAMEKDGAVGAMCEDYRAAASIDLEEQQRDIKEGNKIRCPLRVLWGKNGVVGTQFNALSEWRKVCSGELQGLPVDSGHFIPEEIPDELVEQVKGFCN